jgi:hypothetical protein
MVSVMLIRPAVIVPDPVRVMLIPPTDVTVEGVRVTVPSLTSIALSSGPKGTV